MFEGEVLVAGLGSIGERHVRNLLALGQKDVTVLRRTTKPPRTLTGREFETATSVEDALARRPAAAIVATPNALHVDLLRQTVERGIPTLVEVPLASRLDGLAAIAEQATASRTPVLMGHNLRFHPALAAIRNAVREGVVGDVLYSRSQFGEFLPDCHKWEDYRIRYEARADLGGGAVLTSVHEIDHACWLFGPVVAVSSVVRTRRFLIDVEDVAFILLEHENGVISEVALDFVQRTYRRSLQVAGSDGTIEWELLADRARVFEARTSAWRDLFAFEVNDIPKIVNQTYLDELAHFARVARRAERPINDLRQGMHVTDVALTALRASRERRTTETDADLRGGFR